MGGLKIGSIIIGLILIVAHFPAICGCFWMNCSLSKNTPGQTEHIFKKSNKKYRFNW